MEFGFRLDPETDDWRCVFCGGARGSQSATSCFSGEYSHRLRIGCADCHSTHIITDGKQTWEPSGHPLSRGRFAIDGIGPEQKP